MDFASFSFAEFRFRYRVDLLGPLSFDVSRKFQVHFVPYKAFAQ